VSNGSLENRDCSHEEPLVETTVSAQLMRSGGGTPLARHKLQEERPTESETSRMDPTPVLVVGKIDALEPCVRALEAKGFTLTREGAADIILAVELSDSALRDLRRDPSRRLATVLLLRESADCWPEGADVVLRWPATPGLLSGQLDALRNRILIERSVSPLSGLPGPRSTEIEIESMFESGNPFYVTYIDINNFKPYNDAYGFERGDMVIGALSRLICESLAPLSEVRSHCGHIGGDDFVIATEVEPDPAMRKLAFEFDRTIRTFYTETDLARRGIVSFDREGKRRKFPLMSITIVSIRCGELVRTEEEMSLRLASMKRRAKSEALSKENSVFICSTGEEEETGTEQALGSIIRNEAMPSGWRRAAIEAAGELKIRELTTYLRAVLKSSGDEKLRKSAAYSLGRMRDRTSVSELIQALSDPSPHVRMRSAEALGEIGDSEALDALTGAASDASSHVRSSAVRSIGRLGVSTAIPSLVRAAADTSVNTRVAAIGAIGALGDVSASSVLVQALEEGPLPVRKAAAETMGRMPDGRSIKVLQELLSSKQPALAWRAAYSISLILKSSLVFPDAEERSALTERLSTNLRSKNGHLLWATALALGSTGDETAATRVAALLRDSRDYVRAAAAVALGVLGNSIALVPLRRALRDGRTIVRAKSAWALGELGGAAAVEALRLALKDSSETVRELAAQSICRLLERLARGTAK
jgi:HEAT repeat protein/GGDEF domain-containing protein